MIYYILGKRLVETTSNTYPDGAVPLTEMQYDIAKLIRKHGYLKIKHNLSLVWSIMRDEIDKLLGNGRTD